MRGRNARYSALFKLLTDQGINVIICTIAMFDEVRDWNRSNIENYVEVFLDVDMEVLKRVFMMDTIEGLLNYQN